MDFSRRLYPVDIRLQNCTRGQAVLVLATQRGVAINAGPKRRKQCQSKRRDDFMSDNVTVYNTRNAAGVTTTWLETEVCYSCSVLFAMPKEMRLRRLNDGGGFWCPNGHMQFYT